MSDVKSEQGKGGPGPGGGHGHDDEITLIVATPKGPWKGVFRKTAKVAEVIKQIVKDMELADEPFQLVHNGKPLEPAERTLVSFGLEGTVKLSLVATGSGV
jgi:hypothetical protein